MFMHKDILAAIVSHKSEILLSCCKISLDLRIALQTFPL